jgi:hypothetical protein
MVSLRAQPVCVLPRHTVAPPPPFSPLYVDLAFTILSRASSGGPYFLSKRESSLHLGGFYQITHHTSLACFSTELKLNNPCLLILPKWQGIHIYKVLWAEPCLAVHVVLTSLWLSHRYMRATGGSSRVMCDNVPGLVSRQRQLCHRHPDVMRAIGLGVTEWTAECQHQFRQHRWNCNTLDRDHSLFGRVLLRSESPAFNQPCAPLLTQSSYMLLVFYCILVSGFVL